ncbi:MAG: DUF4038 domain-containing protein, partial [Patescibacteria group bacterium]
MTIFLLFLFVFLILFLVVFSYFFLGKAPRQKNVIFGVNFSQKGAESLKLDWKETYLAILDDLKTKQIKLITHWDLIEKQNNNYYFDDTDWQVKEAEKREVKMIFVLGIKTGRWPECHDPEWAKNFSKKEEQQELLNYIEKIILRYKDSPSIIAWQVENEPLFEFGECPWQDKDFWKKEIKLVKSLDPARPIIASDSGEQS